MPKKAIIRRTNSVNGGPRSSGGGARNNGFNWPCLLVVVMFLVLPVGGALGFWFGVVAR